MTAIIIEIIIIIILIFLSAFFSSSETALTGVSMHRVRMMQEENVKNADILKKVLDNKSKMLSVILICNNIVNLSASALMTVLFQRLLGNEYVSLGTGLLTLLVLIFGEVAPKTMATYKAERVSLKFCKPIWVLMVILTPLAYIISFLASIVLKVLRIDRHRSKSITEKELRTIVNVSQEEGVIEKEEKTFINNVFDFSDTTVREIMIPRINVTFVKHDATYGEVRAIFEEEMFTRLPVLDEEDKVAGLINIKDFAFYPDSKRNAFKISDIIRPVEFTYEQKKVLELLHEIKQSSINMMIVLDEYGDTAGIVTVEDLLEELVGDIRDEYDEDEVEEIVKVGPDEYEINGYVAFEDVNDKLGLKLDSEEYDSIGGILIEHLGKLPDENDSVRLGNVVLKAQKVEKNRIEKVLLKIEAKEESGDE